MTEGLPAWQPLPLGATDSDPPELPRPDGPALVLLASPATRASGWSARAAARLARRRAGGDGRLLLADLDLQHPRLHEELGTENGEGVSDAFLFGASLERVARPVEGFLFVPAGTAVQDPSRVLASPRWEAVTDGFEGAGAELFLLLPWELPGRDAILGRAGRTVLLAEREELAGLQAGGAGVDAVLGPDEAWTTARAAAVPGREPEPVDEPAAAGAVAGTGAGDAVAASAPGRAAGREEAAEAAVTTDAPPPALDPTTRTDRVTGRAPRRPAAPERGRRPLAIAAAVLALLVLAVVAAALAGLVDVPGIPQLGTDEAAEDPGGAPAAAAAAVDPGPGDTAETPGATTADDAAAAGPTTAGGDDEPGAPAPAAAPVVERGGGAERPPERAAPPPARTPAAGGADPAPRGEPSGVTPADPTAMERSMAVGSYRDLGEALERVDTLNVRAPDLVVAVSPVEIDGLEWHRILVAPVPTGSEAAVRSAMGSRLGDSNPSGWFLRPTPLAFRLFETDSLESARVRIETLRDDGIPAYLLEAPPSPDRDVAYRVYAGAYADAAEADHMRELLRSAGLQDAPLEPREGRAPGTSPSG